MCRLWNNNQGGCNHFPNLSKKNRTSLFLLKALTPVKVFVLVFLLMIVSGGFYLNLINQSATTGYQINELENEMTSLQDENAKLSLQYVQLKSVDNIVSYAKKSDLVAVINMEVIDNSGMAVAMR
ncbi:MAG: hypothetical protein WCL61_02710 [bacterium]